MKKGEYVDKEIIRLRDIGQNGTKAYDLLTDEIPVHRKRIRFQWFSLFEGEFRILLPENFVRMPEKIAKVRYISIYRPPVIYSCRNYDENFGFHLLEDEDTELDSLIRQMQDTVLFHSPETVIYEKGTVYPKGLEGRWFDYKNFTVDEETYNMQFLIRSDNCLLAGTFNCRMLFYDEWKPLVLKSLEQVERTGKRMQTDESR